MTTGSLMKVKCIAELLTCIKRYWVLKNIFGRFESDRFTQVLLYYIIWAITENLCSGIQPKYDSNQPS